MTTMSRFPGATPPGAKAASAAAPVPAPKAPVSAAAPVAPAASAPTPAPVAPVPVAPAPASTPQVLPAVVPPPAAVIETGDGLPSVDDLLADAGDRDAVGREDLAIPFIAVVQSLSPVRQEGDPAFITGASEGDLYNTVTRELFKKGTGVVVVPVMFKKLYLEWVPRAQGGGFRGSHTNREETGATQNKDTGKWVTADGNEIIDTAEHYVLVQSTDGTWSPALLSMTSTKLKVSRQWNTRMSMVKIPGTQVTPASYAKAYQLTTVLQKNDKGVFYNFAIAELPGFVPKDVYDLAKNFRAQLIAGAVRTDYTKAAEADDDAPGAAPDAPGAATF